MAPGWVGVELDWGAGKAGWEGVKRCAERFLGGIFHVVVIWERSKALQAICLILADRAGAMIVHIQYIIAYFLSGS